MNFGFLADGIFLETVAFTVVKNRPISHLKGACLLGGLCSLRELTCVALIESSVTKDQLCCCR